MRPALVLMSLVLLAGCKSGDLPAVTSGLPVREERPSLRDTHEQLQGALWMQTAAEYRILAETTYRMAGEALRDALADPAWSAAIEQGADPGKLPAAIILDLDETVLDNSPFQGEQVLRREPFSEAFWGEWVALEKATAIPGAVEFLDQARSQGVKIFFVTNRTLAEEPATLENLAALGIPSTADEILSNKENGWSSDKTERRRYVAKDHRILLLLGDDLGDFLPARLPPADRIKAAQEYSDWWGRRWFLLPNPMYGSWDRALYDFEVLPDEEVLQRKRALVEGFEKEGEASRAVRP